MIDVNSPPPCDLIRPEKHKRLPCRVGRWRVVREGLDVDLSTEVHIKLFPGSLLLELYEIFEDCES